MPSSQDIGLLIKSLSENVETVRKGLRIHQPHRVCMSDETGNVTTSHITVTELSILNKIHGDVQAEIDAYNEFVVNTCNQIINQLDSRMQAVESQLETSLADVQLQSASVSLDDLQNTATRNVITNGFHYGNLTVNANTLEVQNLNTLGETAVIKSNAIISPNFEITSESLHDAAVKISQSGSQSQNSDFIDVRVNGDSKLVVKNTGMIGVNNANPTKHLDVVGDVNFTGKINDVTAAELSQLSGSTDSLQTQINNVYSKIATYSQEIDDHLSELKAPIAAQITSVTDTAIASIDTLEQDLMNHAIDTSNYLMSTKQDAIVFDDNFVYDAVGKTVSLNNKSIWIIDENEPSLRKGNIMVYENNVSKITFQEITNAVALDPGYNFLNDTKDMVAWYQFDDVTNPGLSSVNSSTYNLTYNGSSPASQYAFSTTDYKKGTSSLTRVSQQISLGNTLLTSPILPQIFTISIWIKVLSSSQSGTNSYLSTRSTGLASGFLFYKNSSYFMRVHLNHAGDVFGSFSYNTDIAWNNPSYIANDWNHVVITFDSITTKQLKVYLNNTEVLNKTESNMSLDYSVVFNSTSFYIAMDKHTDSYYLNNGIFLDDLRIYNRTLTEDEINTLYTGESLGTADPDLLLDLKFDGDLTDSSVNNNTVTAYGNPTFDSTIVKYGTNSIYFDGNSQYLSIPSTNFGALDGLTFSIWVYFTEDVRDRERIIDFGDSNYTNYIVIIRRPDNELNFTISSCSYYFANSVTVNTWMHICWTIQKSPSTWYIYINGSLQIPTTTINTSIWPNNTTLQNCYIAYTPSPHPYFKGYIDDFRIYTRAITAEEVTKVYNGESLVTTSTTSDKEYPPINISGSELDVSGFTSTIAGQEYGNGDYKIYWSSSSTTTAWTGMHLFNNTTRYSFEENTYDIETGLYKGNKHLVKGYDGEWVVLEFPVQFLVSSVKIVGWDFSHKNIPKDFKVYGSDDNKNWNELGHFIDPELPNGFPFYFVSNITTTEKSVPYKFIGLCFHKTHSATTILLNHIVFFGKEYTKIFNQYALETDLENKSDVVSGAASSVMSSDFTDIGKILVSDDTGKIASSTVDVSVLNNLLDVDSNIQLQIDTIDSTITVSSNEIYQKLDEMQTNSDVLLETIITPSLSGFQDTIAGVSGADLNFDSNQMSFTGTIEVPALTQILPNVWNSSASGEYISYSNVNVYHDKITIKKEIEKQHPYVISNGSLVSDSEFVNIGGYDYTYSFTTSNNNSITFPTDCLIDVLIVGGGGSGGSNLGGGGGGGTVFTAYQMQVKGNMEYPIIVGEGGSALYEEDGGDSSAFGIVALGGGAGGNSYRIDGRSKGTGGGGSISADGTVYGSGGKTNFYNQYVVTGTDNETYYINSDIQLFPREFSNIDVVNTLYQTITYSDQTVVKIMSSSIYSGGFEAYKMFDHITNDGRGWALPNGYYDSVTKIGNRTFIYDYPGEWFSVDMGEKILLNNIIMHRSGFAGRAPLSFRIYATNDENVHNTYNNTIDENHESWKMIHEEIETTSLRKGKNNFWRINYDINASNPYRHYLLVINKAQATYVEIDKLYIYGRKVVSISNDLISSGADAATDTLHAGGGGGAGGIANTNLQVVNNITLLRGGNGIKINNFLSNPRVFGQGGDGGTSSDFGYGGGNNSTKYPRQHADDKYANSWTYNDGTNVFAYDSKDTGIGTEMIALLINGLVENNGWYPGTLDVEYLTSDGVNGPYKGAFFVIDFGETFVLNTIKIYPRPDQTGREPKTFRVYASNTRSALIDVNDPNWVFLKDFESTKTGPSNAVSVYELNENYISYRYYLVIVQQAISTGTITTQFTEIEFYSNNVSIHGAPNTGGGGGGGALGMDGVDGGSGLVIVRWNMQPENKECRLITDNDLSTKQDLLTFSSDFTHDTANNVVSVATPQPWEDNYSYISRGNVKIYNDKIKMGTGRAKHSYDFASDTTDMIVWYKFDSDFTDSSGNGYDATATGIPTISNNEIISITKDNYLTLPSNIIDFDNDITISFWYRFDNNLSFGRLMSLSSTTNQASESNSITISRNSNATQMYFIVDGNAVSRDFGHVTSGSLTHLTWVIKKSTKLWIIYKNGIQDYSDIKYFPTTNTYIHSYLGKSNWNNEFNNDNQISLKDFRIYNRALSAEEIQEIYEYRGETVGTCELRTNTIYTNSIIPYAGSRSLQIGDGIEISNDTVVPNQDEISVNGISTTHPIIEYTDTNDVLYKYCAFTSDGSITFSQDTVCDVLVVGGGGSGTTSSGGGAGGLIYEQTVTLNAGTYTITVGIGGTAPSWSTIGNNGGNSKITSSSSVDIYEAIGGGGGAHGIFGGGTLAQGKTSRSPAAPSPG